MMKFMILMMKMIPPFIRRKIPAPMISRGRREYAEAEGGSIGLNLDNLLVCADFCGTCPSNPRASGEGLFCATGKSAVGITENGCNCIICPLFEKCSVSSAGYFCRDGSCSGSAEAGEGNFPAVSTDTYLNRFLLYFKNRQIESPVAGFSGEVRDIELDFLGDKIIPANSRTSFLTASLEAGIEHMHVCGGNARCSTCRVLVTKGLEHCIARNAKEAELADLKGFSPDIRLACQTSAESNVTLRRLVLDTSDISEAIHEGRISRNVVGSEIQAAILFSDIRSFTSFSEANLPYDIVHILNRYFNLIGDIIDANGGYIDKYMGDGIMVIFGLDEQFKEHPASLAVRCAIEMNLALKEFNEYLEDHFNHKFNIGTGIHFGNVIAGNLGFRKKMEFTAIGDTVNTASRIESLNKRTGTNILVSDTVKKAIEPDKSISWGRKIRARVKGKSEEIVVHEVLAK